MKQVFRRVMFIVVLLSMVSVAFGQFDFGGATTVSTDDEPVVPGARWGEPTKHLFRAGIKIQPGPTLRGVRVTLPVPRSWGEEQRVRIVEDTTAPHFLVQEKNLGGVKIAEFTANELRVVTPIEAVLTFEVVRREPLPPTPEETLRWQIPAKLTPELNLFVRDESPKIEHRKPKFAEMFKEVTSGAASDWGKVEAIYDYVRERLAYDEGDKKKPAKGAWTTISDGNWCGDCKDMTFVFIALCRAGKIPARAVRLPTHCYAEFYLEEIPASDTTTTATAAVRRPARNVPPPPGRWFSCQLAGDPDFGGIRGSQPILQRGDNYIHTDLSGNPERMYYYKEFFEVRSNPSGGSPKFTFVHEVVGE